MRRFNEAMDEALTESMQQFASETTLLREELNAKAEKNTSLVAEIRDRRAAEDNVAELTTDEEQVLRLIAVGHSHQEIATRSSLDVARVLAIRAAATSKTGGPSRIAIVRYAETRGWLQHS